MRAKMTKALTWTIIVLTMICLCALSYAEYFLLHPITEGLKAPDFRLLGYSYDEFAAWEASLGEEGTAIYLAWFTDGIDVYLPTLVGLTIALLLHGILSRFPRYRARSAFLKTMVLAIFALPYVFFDHFENLIVSDAIDARGNAGVGIIEFASSMTVLKFSFVGIALVVIFALWMASLKQNGKLGS